MIFEENEKISLIEAVTDRVIALEKLAKKCEQAKQHKAKMKVMEEIAVLATIKTNLSNS